MINSNDDEDSDYIVLKDDSNEDVIFWIFLLYYFQNFISFINPLRTRARSKPGFPFVILKHVPSQTGSRLMGWDWVLLNPSQIRPGCTPRPERYSDQAQIPPRPAPFSPLHTSILSMEQLRPTWMEPWHKRRVLSCQRIRNIASLLLH